MRQAYLEVALLYLSSSESIPLRDTTEHSTIASTMDIPDDETASISKDSTKSKHKKKVRQPLSPYYSHKQILLGVGLKAGRLGIENSQTQKFLLVPVCLNGILRKLVKEDFILQYKNCTIWNRI